MDTLKGLYFFTLCWHDRKEVLEFINFSYQREYCRLGISKRYCNARSLITRALAKVLQILFKDVFIFEISSVSVKFGSLGFFKQNYCFRILYFSPYFYVRKAKFMDGCCRFASLSSFCLISLQDLRVISATCTTELGEESHLDVIKSSLNEYRCSCKGSKSNAQCTLHYLACPIQAP